MKEDDKIEKLISEKDNDNRNEEIFSPTLTNK